MPKNIRLSAAHEFIMKMLKKTQKIQQITSNYLSDIEFKDFMKVYKDYIKEPFSFLVKNATLLSDDPLRFKKNLL